MNPHVAEVQINSLPSSSAFRLLLQVVGDANTCDYPSSIWESMCVCAFVRIAASTEVPMDSVCERNWSALCPDGVFV